jgi:hypothetical protein
MDVYERIAVRNEAFWRFLTDDTLTNEERLAELERALGEPEESA